jgi:hypothetical protein
MQIKKIISNFHFLKMHKLCHVVICNWLLGKLYIVIIGCNKLYNQSIWLRPYISSMCIVLMSCLVMIYNKMFSAVRLMQLMEYLATKVICNWFLVINWSHNWGFYTRVNDIFFSHLWCLLKKFILDFDISIPYFIFLIYCLAINWPNTTCIWP